MTLTRHGRWGVRQIDEDGNPTGGGTIWCGYETREAALGTLPYPDRYEVYDRFPTCPEEQR